MVDDRSHLTPLALLTGVTAISFAAIFFRLAQPTPPLIAAGTRLGIAALLLSPFVLRLRIAGGLDARFIRHGLAAGVFYAVHFGTWVWSLGLTSVAASVTLVTATPLLLALLSLATGVDRPDRSLWLSLALAVVGIGVIGGVDVSSAQALLGDALALVGAAAMAGYMLVVRRLGVTSVFAFTGIATAFGAVLLLFAALLLGVPVLLPSNEALGFLALSALVPQLIGHSALTWSLKHTEPTRVGVATLGEPVGAAFLAYTLLGESPTVPTVVGCAITIVAVALALRAMRQSRRSTQRTASEIGPGTSS